MKKFTKFVVRGFHVIALIVFSYYFVDTLQDVFYRGDTEYWPGIFVFGASVMYAVKAIVEPSEENPK